jgi:hypothetical protein
MMPSTAADHASSDRAWHHLDTARTATALPRRAAEGCAEPQRPQPCWFFYYGLDEHAREPEQKGIKRIGEGR